MDADIQSNFHSDSNYMKEYIQSKKVSEQEEQVIADEAFYSFENAEAAAKKGILIIPTSLAGMSTNPLCAEFKFSEDGRVLNLCTNGCCPISQTYHEESGKIDAKFSHEYCNLCPLRNQCPGQDQKKTVKVSILTQVRG